MDVKCNQRGHYEVYTELGKKETGLDPVRWAQEAQKLGAGEILLNSIDRDGTMTGFDLELISQVCAAVSIPVVACGGAGDWHDFVDAVVSGHASAVAAANIFHYREQSTRQAKKHMKNAGIDVRYDDFFMPKFTLNLQSKKEINH